MPIVVAFLYPFARAQSQYQLEITEVAVTIVEGVPCTSTFSHVMLIPLSGPYEVSPEEGSFGE